MSNSKDHALGTQKWRRHSHCSQELPVKLEKLGGILDLAFLSAPPFYLKSCPQESDSRVKKQKGSSENALNVEKAMCLLCSGTSQMLVIVHTRENSAVELLSCSPKTPLT